MTIVKLATPQTKFVAQIKRYIRRVKSPTVEWKGRRLGEGERKTKETKITSQCVLIFIMTGKCT